MRANDFARIALTPAILITAGANVHVRNQPEILAPHHKIAGFYSGYKGGIGIFQHMFCQFRHIVSDTGIYTGHNGVGLKYHFRFKQLFPFNIYRTSRGSVISL